MARKKSRPDGILQHATQHTWTLSWSKDEWPCVGDLLISPQNASKSSTTHSFAIFRVFDIQEQERDHLVCRGRTWTLSVGPKDSHTLFSSRRPPTTGSSLYLCDAQSLSNKTLHTALSQLFPQQGPQLGTSFFGQAPEDIPIHLSPSALGHSIGVFGTSLYAPYKQSLRTYHTTHHDSTLLDLDETNEHDALVLSRADLCPVLLEEWLSFPPCEHVHLHHQYSTVGEDWFSSLLSSQTNDAMSGMQMLSEDPFEASLPSLIDEQQDVGERQLRKRIGGLFADTDRWTRLDEELGWSYDSMLVPTLCALEQGTSLNLRLSEDRFTRAYQTLMLLSTLFTLRQALDKSQDTDALKERIQRHFGIDNALLSPGRQHTAEACLRALETGALPYIQDGEISSSSDLRVIHVLFPEDFLLPTRTEGIFAELLRQAHRYKIGWSMCSASLSMWPRERLKALGTFYTKIPFNRHDQTLLMDCAPGDVSALSPEWEGYDQRRKVLCSRYHPIPLVLG
ncbi:MAG TPA: hypothetical protein DCE42_00390 [Myxococcales bacterium]|nr:hypothetical protein [Deltaproteobacteria bacterium]HAA53177.1 hypothetical protein [Myxococcales bacterium]|tara:strand:+ start:6186 stop:7709 length:1524 start_codon:yes stop_codon:yes gene_type:complete